MGRLFTTQCTYLPTYLVFFPITRLLLPILDGLLVHGSVSHAHSSRLLGFPGPCDVLRHAMVALWGRALALLKQVDTRL